MSNAGPSLSGASSGKSRDDIRFATETRDIQGELFHGGSKNVLNVGNFLNLLQDSTPN